MFSEVTIKEQNKVLKNFLVVVKREGFAILGHN